MSDNYCDYMYTTGLTGLDSVLHGIRPGDNLVWAISEVREYRSFVVPFAEAARKQNKKVTYFRFADHPPLLQEGEGIEIIELNPHIVKARSRSSGRISSPLHRFFPWVQLDCEWPLPPTLCQ
jgi:hypothetical protein